MSLAACSSSFTLIRFRACPRRFVAKPAPLKFEVCLLVPAVRYVEPGPMARRLVHRYAISDIPSEVFTVRFSNDGGMLATGCNDGNVRVYTTAKGSLVYTLPPGVPEAMPVTALRFRPAAASKTKNVLLAGSKWILRVCHGRTHGQPPRSRAAAGGQIFHWHVTSGKCISRITEPDNQVSAWCVKPSRPPFPYFSLRPLLQIFCVDYRADGLAFATAGKQTCVRVYDEGTRLVTATLSGGVAGVTPGHSNRIFSLKFDPNDDNTIVSAGWDNTVQVGGSAGPG